MAEYSIILSNVTKRYSRALLLQVAEIFGIFRMMGVQVPKRHSVAAVEDVTLSVQQGERVGVIGHNGAGKTTLLQLMAGLSTPSSGTLNVSGRINCVMTLGVGLREELSGRENIYLDGSLQGKPRSEIDRVIEDVIGFAGIGKFIDLPLRTYSSGMKARLAFAMITSIMPEILMIDEALSAGDASFNAKAAVRMRQICEQGKILILVSHSMSAIHDMCNRCLWLDHGHLFLDGPPAQVVPRYLDHVRKIKEGRALEELRHCLEAFSYVPGHAIAGLRMENAAAEERVLFRVGDTVYATFAVSVADILEEYDLRLTVERTDGLVVLDNLAGEDGLPLPALRGERRFRVDLTTACLGHSSFKVTVALLGAKGALDVVLAQASTILRLSNPPYYTYQSPVCWLPAVWDGVAPVAEGVS